MRLLAEFHFPPTFEPSCPFLERTAVRAVIFRAGRLLLVHSSVNHDYKFPGGGVQAGETPQQALGREVAEECGLRLQSITGELGRTVEYDQSRPAGERPFKMTSDYYFCEVEGPAAKLQLDDYECDLGFQPVWVEIAVALQANRRVLSSSTRPPPRWTRRDTFVLELLLERQGMDWLSRKHSSPPRGEAG